MGVLKHQVQPETVPVTSDGLRRNQLALEALIAAASAAGVTTFNTRSGAVTLVLEDVRQALGVTYATNALKVLRVNAGESGFELGAPAAAYTDEQAQDAVGVMVDASLTYVDATPLLQRAALSGAITATAGSNATSLGSFTSAQLNTAISDGDFQPLDTQLTDLAGLSYVGNTLKVVRVNAAETGWELAASGGGGTVTTVSVTTAAGVSGTVLNPTTTPAITIALGAITPTSVAASGNISGIDITAGGGGGVFATYGVIGVIYMDGAAQELLQRDGGFVTRFRLTSDATAAYYNAGEHRFRDLASVVKLTVGTAASVFTTTLAASNLSGTNSGDQTTIVGITGTLAEFNTALTGADFASGGGTATGANTGDQTITLTADVTGSGTGSFAATIAADAVTYAKMQNVSAASRLLGRGDSGAGDPQEIILGTNLTMSGTTLNAAAGGAGGAIGLNQHILAASFTVTAAYASYITRYLEIGATFALEIGAGGDMEIG